jgi:hypothetical protein
MSLSLDKGTLTGLGALASLGLMAAAIWSRRFRIGFVLFNLAVALGERWKTARVRARLGKAVVDSTAANSTRPDSADRPV